jgi:hypothetical protein
VKRRIVRAKRTVHFVGGDVKKSESRLLFTFESAKYVRTAFRRRNVPRTVCLPRTWPAQGRCAAVVYLRAMRDAGGMT